MAKQKVKIKVDKRHLLVFALVFAGAVVVGTVFVFMSAEPNPEGVWFVDYAGTKIPFRVDPVVADRVSALPSEGEIQRHIFKPPQVFGPNGQVIIRQPLKNVTIAFNPQGVGQGRLGWYTVQIGEIINKLDLVYRGRYDVKINYGITEVQDYEGLRGTNTAPIIALVHPDIANGTFVAVDDSSNVIIVSGGDSLEDFDLATTKLLMIALGIDVDHGAI